MAAKDYANTRFSGLQQVNAANVSQLKVAWTFSTGLNRGHEAAPLIVGGTMYIVTRHPVPQQQHVGQSYGRRGCNDRPGGLEDEAGGDQQGRDDDHGPIVVKGKVLVGNSGGEMGVRGWLTAIDAGTGRIAWRAYSTGPDKDVLLGSNFKSFYPQYRGRDLGVQTWPPEAWKIGGGTVWGWISYDPELDLIYYGTGNPGPWNPDQRPGDNLWTSGIFARDPDTGEARWFYQWNPHDLHDYDGINENVLLDLNVNGRPRKVLVRPERNGYVYVLDRATGEVLSADPFSYITSTMGIDLKSGRPILAPDKEPEVGKVIRSICPAAPGAKDWQPSAYSPRTGLLYMPQNNLCMDFEGMEANYIAGTPFVGANVRMYAGPGGDRGEFSAWDPVGRRKVWSVKEKFPAWSGALVTAGDVVFYGTMEGWFKALDARNGKELWKFKTGSGIIGWFWPQDETRELLEEQP